VSSWPWNIKTGESRMFDVGSIFPAAAKELASEIKNGTLTRRGVDMQVVAATRPPNPHM